ncbi:hypothetical protein [Asanoa sp. NPDC050611]|uniref:hypothetical protein n=1 Tax=Asanoa sp. NPDC050611 TaxID=3157098 RepID=UPI0033DC28A9
MDGRRPALVEAGRTSTPDEVTELLVGAADPVVTAVLAGGRLRPAGDIALLVTALRRAGGGRVADRVLGSADELGTDRVAALATGLRAGGADDDADTAVRGATARRAAGQVAALVAALADLDDGRSLTVALDAAESRGRAEFTTILRVADADHRRHAPRLMARVTRWPAAEVVALLHDLDADRPDLADRLVRVLALRLAVEPLAEVVRGLADGRLGRALVGDLHRRTWREVSASVAAIARRPGTVDLLVDAAARCPADRVSAVADGLHNAGAADARDRFVREVGLRRWQHAPYDEVTSPELRQRIARLAAHAADLNRSELRRGRRVRAAVLAGQTVAAAASGLVIATLTTVSTDVGFSVGEWVAWVASSLVLQLVSWAAIGLVLLVRLEDGDTLVVDLTVLAVTVTTVVVLALAGVPPLAETAEHLRDWLAWRF